MLKESPMVTVMSLVSMSRTPNSKERTQCSDKNHFDNSSKHKHNLRSARASSSPAIRSPWPGLNGKSEVVLDINKSELGLQGPGLREDRTLEELEKRAVREAEEATKKINCCLKVAEVIGEDASWTLANLNQQGQQITRTHATAASIDHDLSRGEKLLGSLGGMFSKPWKPVKSRKIQGPVLMRADSLTRRGNHMEQRQKLGLTPRSQSNPRQIRAEPPSTLGRVELEKEKQEAALSGLSNLVVELKTMAVDMGDKINSQNKALDRMQTDVDELNFRIKGANIRSRQLLRR
ncbi:hypothetical protein KSP39_PZI009265 [Platanthera zijinensis]|uniref:t-SNARE coiled-coil homology domain-containing protein n=1 Tax=Platanthera zijinensis TaxID=2320716 RepID=A0AAP0BMK3_9ASPA